MKRHLIILLAFFILIACKKAEDTSLDVNDYKTFTSMREFLNKIQEVAADTNIKRSNDFWDKLKADKRIPFAIGDSVAMLYKGTAQSVAWAGDFNGWEPGVEGFIGSSIGNIWMVVKQLPSNARLDYKIVVNGTQWITDPANSYFQYSGFGPNSELRMPDWIFPEETKLGSGVIRGTLSPNKVITSNSSNLNYKVQYKVYTPANYESLQSLPVIYVTDGQEYSDDRLGAMIIVLDNLIHRNEIQPIIAVFVDPRNPDNNSQNRRMVEYAANIKYANFLADELAQSIDAEYKTNQAPNMRAILGTSMGGWNSAFVGLKRSDKFQLIGIHSPAFDQNIVADYSSSEKLPLKIFMSTGLIHDTRDRARAMRDVLNTKGYQLSYFEINQGHSWGNWKGLIDEPLKFFFGINN